MNCVLALLSVEGPHKVFPRGWRRGWKWGVWHRGKDGCQEKLLLLFLDVLHQQRRHLVAVASPWETFLQEHRLGLSQAVATEDTHAKIKRKTVALKEARRWFKLDVSWKWKAKKINKNVNESKKCFFRLLTYYLKWIHKHTERGLMKELFPSVTQAEWGSLRTLN